MLVVVTKYVRALSQKVLTTKQRKAEEREDDE